MIGPELRPSIVKETELDRWLKVIERNWQNIPEFEVSAEKLRHLAVICDGNRRAAQERGLKDFEGHRAGVEVIRGISRACRQWGIKTLTFWTWSTENWSRDERQVVYVMGLAGRFLADADFKRELIKDEVRFVHLGRKNRLPLQVKQTLIKLEELTRDFDRYHLNLGLDYGGADEAARAAIEIHYLINDAKLTPEELLADSSLLLDCFDTRGQALVDLVVRTGNKEGELPHTSGFMPLQTAYSCWSFTPDLFPNLTPQQLLASIKQHLDYERRRGR